MKKEDIMYYKTFDTHKYIKSLQETGFNEKQAEVLVKSLLESRDFDLSILATREQVADMKSDLKKEIAQLDAKLNKEISATHEQVTDVKSEISDVRKEIVQLDNKLSKEISSTREQISDVKSDLQKEISDVRGDIKQIKADMLKWIVPILITIIIAIFFKR